MISVSFALTVAQTKMLLKIAYHDLAGDMCLPVWNRPNAQNDFVGVVQRLIAKGLVSHHDECPAYRITDEGMAVANMILRECRWTVELAESASDRMKKLKPIIDTENRMRSAYRKRMTAIERAVKP